MDRKKQKKEGSRTRRKCLPIALHHRAFAIGDRARDSCFQCPAHWSTQWESGASRTAPKAERRVRGRGLAPAENGRDEEESESHLITAIVVAIESVAAI